MSTSILNVWITNLGDPCTITNDSASGIPHAWNVAVSQCDGRVVNWSEGRYRFRGDDKWIPIPYRTPSGGVPGWWYEMIPTKDGHVEIEIPPGSYVLRATMKSWFEHGHLFGNWATDHAIVQVSCGDEACATLYAPSASGCSIPLFDFVLPLYIQNKIISRDQADRVMGAMKDVFKPEAGSSFEQGEFVTLRRAFDQMVKEEPGSKKSA